MIPECHLSTFSFKQKISLLPTTSGGWEVLGVETPQYRESDKIGGERSRVTSLQNINKTIRCYFVGRLETPNTPVTLN